MSRPRNPPRKKPFHWSRATRQRERYAAFLAAVGLQFEKEGNGFSRLKKIEKRNEEDSSSTGTLIGESK